MLFVDYFILPPFIDFNILHIFYIILSTTNVNFVLTFLTSLYLFLEQKPFQEKDLRASFLFYWSSNIVCLYFTSNCRVLADHSTSNYNFFLLPTEIYTRQRYYNWRWKERSVCKLCVLCIFIKLLLNLLYLAYSIRQANIRNLVIYHQAGHFLYLSHLKNLLMVKCLRILPARKCLKKMLGFSFTVLCLAHSRQYIPQKHGKLLTPAFMRLQFDSFR